MSADAQRLFDIPAAVEYLRTLGATGATKNFVRNLIASGQVAHLRIGKKFYISKNAIEAWISKRERRS